MRVEPEVAQELAQVMELDNAAEVLERFARGCQCYVGRIDGYSTSCEPLSFNLIERPTHLSIPSNRYVPPL